MDLFISGLLFGLFFAVAGRKLSRQSLSFVLCACAMAVLSLGLSIDVSPLNKTTFLFTLLSITFALGFCSFAIISHPDSNMRQIWGWGAVSLGLTLVAVAVRDIAWLTAMLLFAAGITMGIAQTSHAPFIRRSSSLLVACNPLFFFGVWMVLLHSIPNYPDAHLIFLTLGYSSMAIGQILLLRLILMLEAVENQRRDRSHQFLSFAHSLSLHRSLKTFRHDIRQPLSTVNIVAGVGKMIAKTDEIKQRFSHITVAHHSASAMLTEFCEGIQKQVANSLVGSQSQVELEWTDLNQLLEKLASEYRFFTDAKGLELRVHPTERRVWTQRALLEKVIRNALDNAVKYTPSGGILLAVRESQSDDVEKVTIQVADTGVGHDSEVTPATDKGWGFGSTIIQRCCADIHAKYKIARRGKISRGTVVSIVCPASNVSSMVLKSNAKNQGKMPAGVFPLPEGMEMRVRIALPGILFPIPVDNSAVETLLKTEARHPNIGFYIAYCADLQNIVELEERVMDFRLAAGHPLPVIVGCDGPLLDKLDSSLYPSLMITEARREGRRIEFPEINEIFKHLEHAPDQDHSSEKAPVAQTNEDSTNSPEPTGRPSGQVEPAKN